ncbi:ABC transporter substrate-binding protein [Streptomyces sp. NPDC055005]
MSTHLMPHGSRPDVPPARRIARPRLAVLATALVAVLTPALGACAGGAASAGGGGAGGNGTLKWTSSYFPAHWDPVVSGSGAQFRELALVYASLTRTDETGNAVPDLAESWEYNDKGDQVTFHLRPGLKFTDGVPLDATAVKDAVERAKKQKNSALFGDLTSIQSVEANGLDAVLHLTQVDYQIPQLLGQRVLQIASPKAAATPEKLDQNPVGAGPFTITRLVPGTKAVLKKNPAYWDAKNIHIDNVELTAAPDASTVVNGLQTGVYNFADFDRNLALLGRSFGAYDFSVHDLDAPFPDVAHLAEKGGRTGAAKLIERARTESLTLRQVGSLVNEFHRSPFVGSPDTVADTIEKWFEARTFDGINLAFRTGDDLELFVDGVVPLLRKRGLFRTEYAADTLRGNLGLPIPANRHSRAPQLVNG